MRRRQFLVAAAMMLFGTVGAVAGERFTYEAKAFEAALEAGKPILVHVTAPWCVECGLQKPIVATLAQQPEFANLTIFDVDFDTQKDALRALKVQTQSTLVVFKSKAEVARAVGITRREAIENVLKKAL